MAMQMRFMRLSREAELLIKCTHFATRFSTPTYLVILMRPERVPRNAVSTPASILHIGGVQKNEKSHGRARI